MTQGSAIIYNNKGAPVDSHVGGVLHNNADYWHSSLTYGWTTSANDYGTNYGLFDNTYDVLADYTGFDANAQALMKSIVESDDGNSYNAALSIEGFTNLNFAYSASPALQNIRGGYSGNLGPYGGYASRPWDNAGTTAFTKRQMGDFWINDAYVGTGTNYSDPLWKTIAHEIGHTLGLKHTFNNAGSDFPALTGVYDSFAYSIMSYGGDYWSLTPQSFMMGDIAALQHLYGADYTTSSGNNTYSWNLANANTYNNGNVMIDGDDGSTYVLMTVWDGGGVDTYDFTNYGAAVTIDLRPGGATMLDYTQRIYQTSTDIKNIYNAALYDGDTRSAIENANGSSSTDTMWGNLVANVLTGNGGNDSLFGLAGMDTLYGNAGSDTLYGGGGGDTLWGGSDIGVTDVFVIEGGNDIIKDFQDGVDDIGVSGFGWGTIANMIANATQASGHTTIWSNDSTRSVKIENFLKSQLTADDVYFAGTSLPEPEATLL